MNRPIHFEIPAENPERAMRFYEKVFGWEFERWNGPMEYWTIRTGDSQPGIDGGPHGPYAPGAALREYDRGREPGRNHCDGCSRRRLVRGAQDAGARYRLAGLLQRH